MDIKVESFDEVKMDIRDNVIVEVHESNSADSHDAETTTAKENGVFGTKTESVGIEEVKELLRQWGLQDLSDSFINHRIDSFVLEHLTESDIRDLIPIVGLRVKFRFVLQEHIVNVGAKLDSDAVPEDPPELSVKHEEQVDEVLEEIELASPDEQVSPDDLVSPDEPQVEHSEAKRPRLSTPSLDSNVRSVKHCPLSDNPTLRAILEGDNKLSKRLLRITVSSLKRICAEIPNFSHGWPIEYRVIVFLFWLAHGASYEEVALYLGLAKSTVKDVVQLSLGSILILYSKVISIPDSTQLVSIGQGFASRTHTLAFSRAVGAINQCNIPIPYPVEQHKQYNINRNLECFIVLQAVCDHNGKFLHVYLKHPLPVEEHKVFYNSDIYGKALYPPPGYFLLGSNRYAACMTPVCIVTQFKETPLKRSQMNFNRHHSMGTNIVDRSFGMLKTRWARIFNKPQESKPISEIWRIIEACFVIHNICVASGDVFQPDDEAIVDLNIHITPDIDKNALDFQNELCKQLNLL